MFARRSRYVGFGITAILALAGCSSSSSPEPASPSASSSPQASANFDLRQEFGSVDSALLTAARTGDLELARLAIAEGADVDAYDPESFFPAVSYAVMNDDLAMLTLLVDAGAMLEDAEYRWTVMVTAGYAGGAELTRYLLDQGLSADGVEPLLGSPLSAAAYSDNAAAARALLEAGANPDLTLPADRAEGDVTPLVTAAWNNNAEVAKVLLEYGADTTFAMADGSTARSWAEYHRNDELVLLIDLALVESRS